MNIFVPHWKEYGLVAFKKEKGLHTAAAALAHSNRCPAVERVRKVIGTDDKAAE